MACHLCCDCQKKKREEEFIYSEKLRKERERKEQSERERLLSRQKIIEEAKRDYREMIKAESLKRRQLEEQKEKQRAENGLFKIAKRSHFLRYVLSRWRIYSRTT